MSFWQILGRLAVSCEGETIQRVSDTTSVSSDGTTYTRMGSTTEVLTGQVLRRWVTSARMAARVWVTPLLDLVPFSMTKTFRFK
jgi:hypothetical protein